MHLIKRKRQRHEILSVGRPVPCLVQEGIQYDPDIAYIKDGDRFHRLDLYCPRIQKPLPVVMYVHGDLICGQKEDSTHFCMNLCKKGFLVFSVNYRPAPETGLEEQIQDLADAADYIRGKGLEMKMQSDNLFLAGDGAGAMLCYYLLAIQNDPALAALMKIETAPVMFAAAAYLAGPVYETRVLQNRLALRWTGKEKYHGYRCLPTDNPRLVKHQPPTMFMTNREDPGHKRILKIASAYQEMHKVSQITRLRDDADYYTGMPMMDPELPESNRMMEEMAEFFERWRINKTY